MHTPKKKKSEDGYYPQSQYVDGAPSSLDSSGYNGLTQTNQEEAPFYRQSEKRIIRSNNLINLNVGGTKYTTTLSTLAKDQNSNLYKYAYCTLNGLECPEGDGDFSSYFNYTDSNSGGVASIFIDRDGKTFQFILNFLRDGDLICPDDPFVYQSIMADAKFYNIQKLLEILRAKVEPPMELTIARIEPAKDVEMLSNQSQNTQLDFTESIPLTQVTHCDFFMPQNNVFLRIQENDNIEESSPFVQTTPVHLLGKEEFSTTVDF